MIEVAEKEEIAFVVSRMLSPRLSTKKVRTGFLRTGGVMNDYVVERSALTTAEMISLSQASCNKGRAA